QYWQYFRETGCWVEEPLSGLKVSYPFTRADLISGPQEAMAGEYIQHFCPDVWTPLKALELAALGTTCADPGSKDLGSVGLAGVAGCSERASADKECGSELFSNGT
ncbi:unnamed protein product, partial [Polarella glacialis]